MLSIFPTIEDDELLYSLLVRYHLLSGNISLSQTKKELFQHRNHSFKIDFPLKLDELAKQVSIFNIDINDDFIYKHTFYGYYLNFAGNDLNKKVLGISRKGGINPGLVTGESAYRAKRASYLKCCKSCIVEEYEMRGFAYWHVHHQLPAVYYCAIHREILYLTDISFNRASMTLPNEELINPSILEPVNINRADLLIKIAEESKLLSSIKIGLEPEYINNIYMHLLYKKGYVSFQKKFLLKKLQTDFVEYFGRDLLDLFNINYLSKEWIRSFLCTNKNVMPLAHILLCIFLEISIKDLKHFKFNVFNPIGSTPPYPCLNVVCLKYLDKVIENFDIKKHRSENKYNIICTCPFCNFKYVRYIPDESEDDIFRYDHVACYGSHFEKSMVAMLEELGNFSEVARKLNVHESTIRRHYHKKIKKRKAVNKKYNPKKDRGAWKELINQGLTNIEILNQDYALYKRLYNNDREWLQTNRPVFFKKNRRNYIDWNERDLNLISEAGIAINELRQMKPPKMISLNTVLVKMNKGSYYKYKDKLPLTFSYIEREVDTRSSFLIRRARYILELWENREGNPKIKKIKHQLNLVREIPLDAREEIESLLEDFLKKRYREMVED